MSITPTQTSRVEHRIGVTPSISVAFASPSGLGPLRNPPPSAAKIGDLCKTLKGVIQAGRCLGFLDDRPWEHRVYSQPSAGDETRVSESLEEFLSRESLPARQKYYPNLPRAIESLMLYRCALALALASAVLHLHNTPWLGESWGMEDILLIKGGKEVEPIGRPYVSKSFATASPAQQSAQLRPHRKIKNDMVFALGVVLLELSYGKPILSLRTTQDGSETSFTKEFIARRLISDIDTREAQNYADAVTRCITGNFGTLNPSFDNKEYRESFYMGVVLPLEQDYEALTQPRKQGVNLSLLSGGVQ